MKAFSDAARVILIPAGLALACPTAGAQGPEPRVRHSDRFANSDAVQTLVPEVLGALPGCGPPGARPGCALKELGAFGGSRWLWFREDEMSDGVRGSTGRLIELADGRRPVAVWGLAVTAASLADAAVLHKPGGDLLHVRVRHSGSGAFTDDVLLAWRTDHWQEIDTLSWIKTIRLPRCYGLWKGPFLNLAALKLDMDVWIDGDGNCCPTGGRLLATFAIETDTLVVVEQRHVPGDGSPSDPGRGIDPARCGQMVLPEP